MRDGYVVLRGVVDVEQIARALRAVNNWFVNGFEASKLAVYAERTYAPELTRSPALVGLCVDSPVLDAANAMVGQELIPPDAAQIALRFPAALDEDVPSTPSGGHIDGLPSPHNGVPGDGQVYAFTILAAVFLSAVPEGCHGNFTVWPGTHLAMARWFRHHGTTVDDAAVVYAESARLAASATPVTVAAQPGDVVLAHHLLVHTVAPHAGPDIRYAVFFRLRVLPWDEREDRVLIDPWHEYVGVPGQE